MNGKRRKLKNLKKKTLKSNYPKLGENLQNYTNIQKIDENNEIYRKVGKNLLETNR